MATTMSVSYRNKILDAIGNNTALQVATAYISLHTADPGATGASEVAGGSYARQAASFGAAAAGSMATDALAEFTDMPACTVTHAGLWDALAGNWIVGGALTASKTVNAGDTFQFTTGNLSLAINNTA
jgi:hypothetical protein